MYETGNIELVNIRGCPFRAVPKGEITLKQRKQAPNSSDLPVYLFKQPKGLAVCELQAASPLALP